jgi:2-polyprenyl-3-methyl-5-hydroxy-6-metoxy-1,4-benzoquinol methylase
MTGPMTPEAVRWAYRLFLDREPENERVVEQKAKNCHSTQELRRSLMNSEEFKLENTVFTTLSGHELPLTVEYSASDDELGRIFSHIQRSWASLGLNDPYYSVLTRDHFSRSEMRKKRVDEFYESGKDEVDRLHKTLERNGVDHSRFRKCLDFGCGAGRICRWLAEKYEAIYASDISAHYLEMAQNYLRETGLSNVIFQHLVGIEDISNFPEVDLIYSVIVLQHNPPPLMFKTVEGFMKALNPGGAAFFQLPTYKQGYRFSLKDYLESEPSTEEMEMHVLPQKVVFDIVRKENGRTLEVVEDLCTSWGLYNTFLVQKMP